MGLFKKKGIEWITYVNLSCRSSASVGESHENAADVQHDFVFSVARQSGNEEAQNEEEIMANQCLFSAEDCHRSVDDERSENGAKHRQRSCILNQCFSESDNTVIIKL